MDKNTTIPGYIAIMGELVGTLESLEQFDLPPEVKIRMRERCLQLKAIHIDQVCPSAICNELKTAQKIHHQTKHLLYVR